MERCRCPPLLVMSGSWDGLWSPIKPTIIYLHERLFHPGKVYGSTGRGIAAECYRIYLRYFKIKSICQYSQWQATWYMSGAQKMLSKIGVDNSCRFEFVYSSEAVFVPLCYKRYLIFFWWNSPWASFCWSATRLSVCIFWYMLLKDLFHPHNYITNLFAHTTHVLDSWIFSRLPFCINVLLSFSFSCV